MRIYVSGSYDQQARLRLEATKLFNLGHQITSTWLTEMKQPAHLSLQEWYHALAVKDVAEVCQADCIICDLDGISTSGGRYVEYGVSIGRYNMLKIVVGHDRAGVFNTLADKQFENWDEVINYLSEHQQGPDTSASH